MKMRKKVFAIGLAALVLASCSSGDAGTTSAPKATDAATQANQGTSAETSAEAPKETYNIVYGFTDTEGSVTDNMAKKFKELIEEKTGGAITVQIYPNSALGGTAELAAGLKDGTINMISQDMTPVVYEPYGVFEMQRLFSSRENAKEALNKDGEFWKALDAVSEEGNIKLLSAVPCAFRQLSANKKIETVADIDGLNMRLMESEIPMAFWKSLGANPTPINIGEVYIALQQGLVEAQENPLNVLISCKFYEQQKYVMETNHKMYFCAQMMNLDFFNSLPAEYQQIVLDVCEEVDEYTYQDCIQVEKDSYQFLKDQGMEVITFPEEEYAKLDEAAAQTYDVVRNSVGDELVDLALKAAGK